MIRPGPWIDPGVRWVTVRSRAAHEVEGGPTQPTGDAAANAPARFDVAASPPNALEARAFAIGGGAWKYDQALVRLSFNDSDLVYLPPGDLFPPHAVGAEAEAPALGTFIGPTVAHLGATGLSSGPGSDMTATGWQVYDEDGWTPGSSLVAPRATATFTDTDIPCDLAGFDYVISGGPDQNYARNLLVVADRQVTLNHLVPPGGTDIDMAAVLIDPIAVAVWCHPPRYRFLFDQALPLRQFPRDDALGGVPRQATDARSVQGSARQGWVSTYR